MKSIKITYKDLNYNNGRFETTAKDIGIVDNDWPEVIWYKGNKFLWSEVGSPVIEKGLLLGMEYRNIQNGLTIYVENK